MAAPVHPSIFVSAAAVAFIAWRMYSRVRRMIGRQRLKTIRPWLTVVLFPVLLVALLLVSMADPLSLGALAGGTAIGVALGIVGLRLTRFEVTPAGLFYTPNAHIGIGLSVLFVGRVAYRAIQLTTSGLSPGGDPNDFTRSPLTLLIFGTLAGYYVSYAIGLLRWSRAAVVVDPAE